MSRRLPIGQRICQECNTRLIPSHELACVWCWRKMPDAARRELEWRRPSERFIVPMSLSATASTERRKLFRSLVQTSYPKTRVFNGLLSVEIVQVGGSARAEVTIKEVLDGLKGWAWPYSDTRQVVEVYFRLEPGAGLRTEVTIRRVGDA